MSEGSGKAENGSAKPTSCAGGSNVKAMGEEENETGNSMQSAHSHETCLEDDGLYGEFMMEENKRGQASTTDRDEWITCFIPTEQDDDPQEYFPIILGHLFSAVFSLDQEAAIIAVKDDGDSNPITSKTENLEYTVDALGSYFLCTNPNCLATELGLDNDRNERRRPNIFASLLVDSSLDMKKVGMRLTRKVTVSAGRKVNISYKIFQFCETDISLMYLGIHPLLPLEGIMRIFVEILRIGLNYLKKMKDPDALKIVAIAINVRVMTIPFLSYQNGGLLDALPSLPKYENANKAIALEVAGFHYPVYKRIMESCSLNGVLAKAFGSTVFLLRNGRWGSLALKDETKRPQLQRTGPLSLMQSRSSLPVSDGLIISSAHIIEKVTSPQARRVNPPRKCWCRTYSRA